MRSRIPWYISSSLTSTNSDSPVLRVSNVIAYAEPVATPSAMVFTGRPLSTLPAFHDSYCAGAPAAPTARPARHRRLRPRRRRERPDGLRTAARRDHERIEAGALLENLDRHRPRARDHVLVVGGVHERHSAFLADARARRGALVVVRSRFD